MLLPTAPKLRSRRDQAVADGSARGGWGCWGRLREGRDAQTEPLKVAHVLRALGVKLGGPTATPWADAVRDGSVLILLRGWACVRNWSPWLLLCVADVKSEAGAQGSAL